MKKILLLAMACLTMYIGFSQDKKTSKAKADTSAVPKIYTCPMHPDVLSDKPGRCPHCGMALLEKITYVCPMHPDVVSDKPGKCPKCGMLLKIRSDKPASASAHKHDSTHKM